MTTKITAAVSRGKVDPFKIETLELADPLPDEVLVKVCASGLCHSDVAVLDGMPMRWPAVLGHEGAGVVEQVGSNVTEFSPGDHVALSFAFCGHCPACLKGRPTRCVKMMPLNFGGARPDGTTTMTAADGSVVCGNFLGQSAFASHALLAASSLVKVPDDLDLNIVAALGCSAQTGAGAILNALRVSAGDSVIVSGTGPVGLGAVMAARAAGATRVVAVDVMQSRLDAARNVGATHTIDGRADDVLAQMMQAVGGQADFAFDSTGVPTVVQNDLAALKLEGQIALAASGLGGEGRGAGAMTGKTVHNVLTGDVVARLFIPRLIDLYLHGMFPIDRVITAYPLADIEAAVDDTKTGKTTKAVLVMP